MEEDIQEETLLQPLTLVKSFKLSEYLEAVEELFSGYERSDDAVEKRVYGREKAKLLNIAVSDKHGRKKPDVGKIAALFQDFPLESFRRDLSQFVRHVELKVGAGLSGDVLVG